MLPRGLYFLFTVCPLFIGCLSESTSLVPPDSKDVKTVRVYHLNELNDLKIDGSSVGWKDTIENCVVTLPVGVHKISGSYPTLVQVDVTDSLNPIIISTVALKSKAKIVKSIKYAFPFEIHYDFKENSAYYLKPFSIEKTTVYRQEYYNLVWGISFSACVTLAANYKVFFMKK